MKKFLSNGRRRYLIFIFFSFLMIILGAQNCSSDTKPGDSASALSAGKVITAFGFIATDNEAAELLADATGEISGTSITVTVPFGVDLTALVATFRTTGESVKVGAITQTSGTTANDFTGSITYTVTAADGSTEDYIVTVTETPRSAKEITAFSFTKAANAELSADITGAISGTSIAVTVPFAADVTALVATFVTTGVSVKVGTITQTSGTTANDFTGSITYIVTAADDSTEEYTVTVGNSENYTAGLVSFTMIHVPGKSFPTDTLDNTTATVANAYLIGDTEVTYELWNAVYLWAISSGGYTFANIGAIGDGTGDTDQHPVTTINWRSAMVWMNALTEYYNAQNGTSLVSVYYMDSGYTLPIKTATDLDTVSSATPGSQDDPYVNPAADGFRLLSGDEWELAARYKGSDSANEAIEYPASSENWWTPGNYASGATGQFDDNLASIVTADVAVFGVTSTATVKSKAANALGLYDMSGNVKEWNFDWYGVGGSFRMVRGGSWSSSSAVYMQVGDGPGDYPYNEYYDRGFRLGRTP